MLLAIIIQKEDTSVDQALRMFRAMDFVIENESVQYLLKDLAFKKRINDPEKFMRFFPKS